MFNHPLIPKSSDDLEEYLRPTADERRVLRRDFKRLFRRPADFGMLGYAVLCSLVLHAAGVSWFLIEVFSEPEPVQIVVSKPVTPPIQTQFFLKKAQPPKVTLAQLIPLPDTPPKAAIAPKPKKKVKKKRRRTRRRTRKVRSKVAVVTPQKVEDTVTTAASEVPVVPDAKPEPVAVVKDPVIKTPPKPIVVAAPPGPDLAGMMARYKRRVARVFRRTYFYPRAANRAGLEGRVVVELTLDQTGKVVSRRVLKSSGHKILDRAALKSVATVHQVPSPPAALKWKRRAIQIPFVYRPAATEG